MARWRCASVVDQDHVRLVTIQREERLNALDSAGNRELGQIWDEFEARDDLWVGVITGSGTRAFSAGNDLKAQAMAGHTPDPQGFAGLTRRFTMTKPVIASVNGIALGGGFELALSCDLIVASSQARFGLPEPTRGQVATTGTHRLVRAIPQKRAMEVLLTGRQISAREALDLGLLAEITEPADLTRCALEWAERICACAPMAVRATKEAAMQGLDAASLEEAILAEYLGVTAVRNSADYREGACAFAEKRCAVWQNR